MLTLKKVCGAVVAGLVTAGVMAGIGAAVGGIGRDAAGDNADASRPEVLWAGAGAAVGFVVGSLFTYFCCCASAAFREGQSQTQAEAHVQNALPVANALVGENSDMTRPLMAGWRREDGEVGIQMIPMDGAAAESATATV